MESLQAYLGNQHPQIIAYIVSRLPSDLAARLFVALPPQLRNAVVQRCRSAQGASRPDCQYLQPARPKRDGKTDGKPARPQPRRSQPHQGKTLHLRGY
ncbi:MULTISPECIES: flagellar motor switch protein FliG [Brucella]|nr:MULTISPECIES: flagellar motor switch protein FliG [Brucella]ACD73637.1 Flagellar motor switch protein FLIG [Brucella abortus S19]MDL4811595.1 hypothetical protein [Brucella abortus]MDT9637539.1 hypothetical protein [Brucella abortus]WLU92796.1 hypothetical protein K1M42_11055 [Brucella abortus]